MSKTAPAIDPPVVEWLEGLFPDRLPSDPTISPQETAALIGEQRVIRRLRVELERQTLHNIVR